jgi:hypothetical protein
MHYKCFDDSNKKPGFKHKGRAHIYETGGVQGKVFIDVETDTYAIEIDGERLNPNATTINSAKQRCRTAVNIKVAG